MSLPQLPALNLVSKRNWNECATNGPSSRDVRDQISSESELIMDLKTILSSLAFVMASLFAFAALILYAAGKVSDQASGGQGEAKLVACVTAAIACTGAGVFITTQNLSIFS